MARRAPVGTLALRARAQMPELRVGISITMPDLAVARADQAALGVEAGAWPTPV
jgi:hypothetical protein